MSIPKQPKGTKVRNRQRILTEQLVVNQWTSLLQQHGYEPRDYPVFELRQRLMKKYGDDEKLIYDLQDHNQKEQLSLRYDLTTQYMEYRPPGKSKTYQFGRVYRRENLSHRQSRYREFGQFDVDCSGYDQSFQKKEVLYLMEQMLKGWGLSFEIVENDRSLIDQMLKTCQLESNLFGTVCSTLDKLEKYNYDWDRIRQELKEKHIDPECIERILQSFSCDKTQPAEQKSEFAYRSSSTLVRGLSYYTQYIFEIVETRTGKTIGGGGMYGEGMGFSIGIDRFVDVLEEVGINIVPLQRRLYVLVIMSAKHIDFSHCFFSHSDPTLSIKLHPVSKPSQIKTQIGKLAKQDEKDVNIKSWYVVYDSKAIDLNQARGINHDNKLELK